MASKRPTIGPAGPPKTTPNKTPRRPPAARRACPRPRSGPRLLMPFYGCSSGQDCRTINDKINDSNRPTWDQYKKDNEDRLNLTGADQKKMMAYRAELDAERARKLARASKTHASLRDGSDDDDASADSDDRKKRKRKREKKKLKKDPRRRRRESSSRRRKSARRKKAQAARLVVVLLGQRR